MLKCSPEAFAKCPTRALCGNINEATFTEGSECDRFNQSVQNQPMTNADRIRTMSDEELCEFLMCDVICDQEMSPDCADCEKCVMDWLQQPAEDKS